MNQTQTSTPLAIPSNGYINRRLAGLVAGLNHVSTGGHQWWLDALEAFFTDRPPMPRAASATGANPTGRDATNQIDLSTADLLICAIDRVKHAVTWDQVVRIHAIVHFQQWEKRRQSSIWRGKHPTHFGNGVVYVPASYSRASLSVTSNYDGLAV